MIPKSTLTFNDGRIGTIVKATSPVIIVFGPEGRHIFAQDYNDRTNYLEVRGQVIIDDEIDWLQ